MVGNPQLGGLCGFYFWETYLVHDVFEGVRAVNGETHEDQVRLRIREWSQSVVLFLPSGIPERELYGLTAWGVRWICDVVLEDRGYVFL